MSAGERERGQHKTEVCQLLDLNRKFVPKFRSELNKGQHESLVANNVTCLRWKDK